VQQALLPQGSVVAASRCCCHLHLDQIVHRLLLVEAAML
jgi:hypothetical protein